VRSTLSRSRAATCNHAITPSRHHAIAPCRRPDYGHAAMSEALASYEQNPRARWMRLDTHSFERRRVCPIGTLHRTRTRSSTHVSAKTPTTSARLRIHIDYATPVPQARHDRAHDRASSHTRMLQLVRFAIEARATDVIVKHIERGGSREQAARVIVCEPIWMQIPSIP